MYRHLTDAEAAAVQRFADAHGRKWKQELTDVYWYNARSWTGGEPIDGALLHSLRNDLGPTWLYDACKIKPAKK